MFKVKITNLTNNGVSTFTFHRETEFNKFLEHYWDEVAISKNKRYRADGKDYIVYTSTKDLERVELMVNK